MKCEKCGSEIGTVLVETFMPGGGDKPISVQLEEDPDEPGVAVHVNYNWTGCDLDEDEQRQTIFCPECGEYSFKNEEISVDNVVRITMFKSSEWTEKDVKDAEAVQRLIPGAVKVKRNTNGEMWCEVVRQLTGKKETQWVRLSYDAFPSVRDGETISLKKIMNR